MKGLGYRQGIPRPSPPKISRGYDCRGRGGEKLGDGGTVAIIVTSACCGSRGPMPRCPYPPQPDAVCGGGCIVSEMRVLNSIINKLWLSTPELVSQPTSLVPRPSDWGEGGEDLVSTAYTCATFSVYFTVKVSVNVYRRYPYIIGLFKI